MNDMTLAEAVQFLTPFADKCWDARSDVIYGRDNGQAGRALKLVLAALPASPTPSNDTLQGRGEVPLRAVVQAEIDRLKGADSSWAIGIRDRLSAALQKDTRHDG